MMVRPIAMRLTALTASLAIGVLAAAGGAAAQSSAPPKLDVGISVTWMGQVPIMIAADKGYLRRPGSMSTSRWCSIQATASPR